MTSGSAAELVWGVIRSVVIKSSRVSQGKNFDLFFMIPPFMIKKTRKKVGEKELFL
jgi:hypothetical protein